MNTESELELEPSLDADPSGTFAHTAVGLAGLGMVGWLGLLLMLLFFLPYEAFDNNAQNDALDSVKNVVTGLGNVVAFFLRAFVGLVGIGINSTLSLIGLILGCSSLGSRRKTAAYTALGLGLAGLSLGVMIVLWRLWALGFFAQ